MNDRAMWAELRDAAESWLDAQPKPAFRESYATVARCLSLCHRLAVEAPSSEGLLERDAFDEAELTTFFRGLWRLATLQEEERRMDVVEARRGVDADARDFQRLRAVLAEARLMILDFRWLPEEEKRRHLDLLEKLSSSLQRSRDDFDVALAGVDDPSHARGIEITRYGWGETLRRVFLGPTTRRNGDARALPPPDPREEA